MTVRRALGDKPARDARRHCRRLPLIGKRRLGPPPPIEPVARPQGLCFPKSALVKTIEGEGTFAPTRALGLSRLPSQGDEIDADSRQAR